MIEPGQTYFACDGSGRRIRIAGLPMRIPGVWGYGTVRVETLTQDGAAVRQRSIKVAQLHTSAIARDGSPRRTGYVLEGQ